MMAVYLLNRSPTQSLDGKTPHEAAWYQKKAIGTSSPSVWLRHIHEGSTSPPRQARSQGAEGHLHRLQTREQGVQVL